MILFVLSHSILIELFYKHSLLYCRQKYESSEEESIKNTDIWRKISKKRKLCFDGASNRKSVPPTVSSTPATDPCLKDNKGSKNKTESPIKFFELGAYFAKTGLHKTK